MTQPIDPRPGKALHDSLAAYAGTVGDLHRKMARIVANQQGSAHSLGRAAAALRAMAARKEGKPPGAESACNGTVT